MEVVIAGEEFGLRPQKAIVWHRHQVLLLADLHLGKVNHFRRSGIAVPTRANDRNLEIIVDLINATRPTRVICLGDLFHSHYNTEWEVFGELVSHFRAVSFELVLGNHDILSDHQYERKGIRVYDKLQLDHIIMTHHPLESIDEGCYNLAGHIHPGVHLRGKGRQSLILPCFYFGKKQGLLPAFGMFTGLARIVPRKEEKVFAIIEDKVLEL
jgi:DNA ligase-associated metallophosphoesterase